MSVDDVPTVGTITSLLNQLLLQARLVKTTTDVVPPLQVSDLENSVYRIGEVLAGDSEAFPQRNLETSFGHAAFEHAAREVFYEQLAHHSIESDDFIAVWNLLDIIQYCSDKGFCDIALVLVLVEELLDSQTIEGCRRVFDYLEPRRELLITNKYTQSKQLTVLRSCNELLRRLSRAEDTVFCGRVYIFMFQSFPLGDKSAVNLRGTFHVENTTTFDQTPAKGEDDDNEMKVDSGALPEAEAEAEATETNSITASTAEDTVLKSSDSISAADQRDGGNRDSDEVMDPDTLYPIFWTLQEVFSNPPKIFNPETLEAFKNGLELTVKKFKSVPKVLQSQGAPRSAEDSKPSNGRKRRHIHDEFASNFNPKYLTSRDLFELELSDLTFQRHVLVQALILIDFLLSLTSKAKIKLARLKPQKAMSYDFTLTDEDSEWATTMRSTIASYLHEGPLGNFYYRMVDNVLSRDKGWVRWKAESCPSIAKSPVSPEELLEAVNGAKKACANKRLRPTPLGSMDLKFLSEAENAVGMEKLKSSERYTRPSIDVLVKEIDTAELDMDFADGGEKQTLLSLKRNATWRALRIASKNRLRMFDKIEDGKNLNVLTAPPPEPTPDPPPAPSQGMTEEMAEDNSVSAPVAGDGDASEIELQDASANDQGEQYQQTEPPTQPDEILPDVELHTMKRQIETTQTTSVAEAASEELEVSEFQGDAGAPR